MLPPLSRVLVGSSLVAGWTPMVVRLSGRSTIRAGAIERTLLGTTWLLCLGLTAAAVVDASSSERTPLVVAGIALEWAGMLGWTWARSALGERFSQIGPATELVERGPYRRLRHPMYVTTWIATFGMALAGGRAREFAAWTALGLVLLSRAAIEEHDLRARFGSRWMEYARRSIGLPGP